MTHSKIEVLPGTIAGARTVLGKMLEEVEPDDVVFCIRLSGDDAHITSTGFKTRDICWAAKILDWNAMREAGK